MVRIAPRERGIFVPTFRSLPVQRGSFLESRRGPTRASGRKSHMALHSPRAYPIHPVVHPDANIASAAPAGKCSAHTSVTLAASIAGTPPSSSLWASTRNAPASPPSMPGRPSRSGGTPAFHEDPRRREGVCKTRGALSSPEGACQHGTGMVWELFRNVWPRSPQLDLWQLSEAE